MDTNEFLANAVVQLEEDLKETRGDLKANTEAVTRLDKHLAVLEAKITTKAKYQSAWVAFGVAIALKVVGIFFDSLQ